MSADPDPVPATRVFGIRHHGPGSARSLRLALDAFRPDMILIEGPADADPLVGHVAADGMHPPVALLAYVPDSPARAAFWPFATFSPEWQALRYAVEHAVPARFCDLPATHTLALDAEPGDRTDPLAELAAAAGYDDPERWWDAIIESTADADTFDAITEAMAALRESAGTADPETDAAVPLSRTARTADTNDNSRGTADTESSAREEMDTHGSTRGTDVIGSTRESADTRDSARSTDGEDSARGSADANDGPVDSPARGGSDPRDRDAPPQGGSIREPVDAHTLRREAYMRQAMRKALKEGATRLAVVCGAWHAPALDGRLGPAAPDARLLKGMPKVKATLTWVPWTHSRLAGASGYGAGITSPGWYHHLFTETEQPVVRWLTKVAATLRVHDLPVSSAHIIESVRLAETLAVLRGRPLPGLSEVTDATRAVLCDGDETMLRLITTELVVGEALGSVPDDTPTVPLDADLRARTRSLRLPRQASARQLDLDLRRDLDTARSHLLHRLRLLGIDWGTPAVGEVRNTGTFRETWTLQWEPELSVAVIEASRWGTTIRTAAEAKLLDTASAPGSSVADLSGALERALLADLGGAVGGLVARLESAAALDHDVTHLLAALPGLVRTLRYGDVRGTDVAALAHVADGLLVRICAGLPGAVTGLDTDAATEVRGLIDGAHLAIATREDTWATEQWLAALRTLADRADVHGALVGRSVRLLCDAGIFDDTEAARRLSAALSVGPAPAEKAAWIDGFLGGRGLLLVHDRELLRLVDTWLRGLDDDQFVATLPLLRRTFGAFESGERQAIAHAVRDGGPVAATPPADGIHDPHCGVLAMRAVTDILEVAG
ncbi:DUF5682 family protein [Nocardia mexicana]|uniref:Uncharacterized protein n=1 Tax=Nocardia mexicana TaxID=279262 RepID=A0A370H8Y7_9NOCA|nr:DUF5682 family protein [Nocardia mexicana]RDI53138.1 hypothetical protein DFR68_103526 [Nocardia mexicana]